VQLGGGALHGCYCSYIDLLEGGLLEPNVIDFSFKAKYLTPSTVVCLGSRVLRTSSGCRA